MTDADARTINGHWKVTLGTLAAVLIVAGGFIQPIVSTVMSSVLTDVQWKTEMQGRVDQHDQEISELKPALRYVTEAMIRVETRLGTLPSQQN